MSWILALSLFSANGTYVKEFASEKQCVSELKSLIAKNQNNDNIKSIACVNSDLLED